MRRNRSIIACRPKRRLPYRRPCIWQYRLPSVYWRNTDRRLKTRNIARNPRYTFTIVVSDLAPSGPGVDAARRDARRNTGFLPAGGSMTTFSSALARGRLRLIRRHLLVSTSVWLLSTLMPAAADAAVSTLTVTEAQHHAVLRSRELSAQDAALRATRERASPLVGSPIPSSNWASTAGRSTVRTVSVSRRTILRWHALPSARNGPALRNARCGPSVSNARARSRGRCRLR